MALAKPDRRSVALKNKSRVKELLIIDTTNANRVVPFLKNAATHAVYESSPYHRPAGSSMGPPAARRYPNASKCDVEWTQQTATRALRDAMAAGRVSKGWEGRWPRYAWHLHGDVLYEARLSNNEAGAYHAYPLEDRRQWPSNFR